MPTGFVAVASIGANRITWSADGITWNLPSVPVVANFAAVCHDGTRFVGVATNGGRIYTSPTGDVWTDTGVDALGGSAGVYSISYGGGRYLVGGGSVKWSTDLITWNAPSTPPNVTGGGSGVSSAYNGSRWVITKFSGTPSATADRVWTSDDGGDTWTARGYPTPGAGPLALTYGGGKFMYGAAGSQVAYSTDGITWTGTTTGLTTIGRDLVYGADKFVMVTDVADRVATSPTGATWTSRHTAGPALRSVAWTGAVFAAVGTDYCITSPDGVTWTTRTIQTGAWIALAAAPVGVAANRRRRGLGLVR